MVTRSSSSTPICIEIKYDYGIKLTINKYKDISGIKYGRALALEPNGKDAHGNIIWLCQCDCGNIFNTSGNRLRASHTKSCGCYNKDSAKNINYSHGHASGHGAKHGKTKTYNAWRAMKRRCYSTSSDSYNLYGAKGIIVCDRWIDSFENFLFDMGEAPDLNSSLDRIDPKGNYHPENCRWATRDQQSQNRCIQKNNKSGVKGVHWKNDAGKWQARLGVNGKRMHLGYFDNIEEAIITLREARVKYHGEFCNHG